MTSEDLEETLAALHARIDAQVAQSQKLADDAARLDADAKTATATVTSPDGQVTVTAHASGAVESVRLASTGSDAAGLGASITATIAKAQRAAADRVISSMEQSLGVDSPLVAAVRRDTDAAFPPRGDASTIEYR